MGQRNSAAVYVDDVHLVFPAEQLYAADGLGREGLVQLNKLDVVNCKPAFFSALGTA